MKIYRVYTTYHETSESGTREYGYYSDRGAAFERAVDVAKERIKKYAEYCKNKTEQELIDGIKKHDTSVEFWDGFSYDPTYIRVKEIEVDKDVTENVIGYT